MKKITTLLLCAALLVGAASAQASSVAGQPPTWESLSIVTPRGSYQLDSYAISLTYKGNGVMQVYYSVYGTHDKMACIGAQSIVIEQKVSATKWTTYKTYSGLYNYDAISKVDAFNVDVDLGGTYRAVLTAYGRDTDGSDTGAVTSSGTTAT